MLLSACPATVSKLRVTADVVWNYDTSLHHLNCGLLRLAGLRAKLLSFCDSMADVSLSCSYFLLASICPGYLWHIPSCYSLSTFRDVLANRPRNGSI